MEDLLKLKPFLRIAQDEDSDVAAATAKMAGFTPDQLLYQSLP